MERPEKFTEAPMHLKERRYNQACWYIINAGVFDGVHDDNTAEVVPWPVMTFVLAKIYPRPKSMMKLSLVYACMACQHEVAQRLAYPCRAKAQYS